LRRVGYWLGWLLLAAALAVVLWDLWGLLQGEGFAWRPLGAVWAALDRDSLLLLQPAIERHLAEWLWSGLVFPLLEAPTVLVLGLPALLLLWLCRPRRQRKFY